MVREGHPVTRRLTEANHRIVALEVVAGDGVAGATPDGLVPAASRATLRIELTGGCNGGRCERRAAADDRRAVEELDLGRSVGCIAVHQIGLRVAVEVRRSRDLPACTERVVLDEAAAH